MIEGTVYRLEEGIVPEQIVSQLGDRLKPASALRFGTIYDARFKVGRSTYHTQVEIVQQDGTAYVVIAGKNHPKVAQEIRDKTRVKLDLTDLNTQNLRCGLWGAGTIGGGGVARREVWDEEED